MTKVLLGLVTVVGLFAQGSSQLVLNSNAPSGVGNVSLSVVGTPGAASYYYWVVPVYVNGMGAMSQQAQVINGPGVLNSTNYVRVNWSAPATAGVTGYYVLRTGTPTVPNPCTCKLTGPSNVTTYSDQGGSLTSFTFAPVGAATGTIALDNTGYTIPRFVTDRPTNSTLFANLPLASNANGLTYLVTDSATGSCSAGGGTNTPTSCWSNGTSWIVLTAGGGGGGGTIGGGGLVSGNFPVATAATTIADSGIVASSVQLKGTTTVSPPPSSQGNGDFWVVRTTPTMLTIGSNCTVAFPCKIAFGSTIYSLTAPATATIGASTDVAYIYVSGAQVLTVGTVSQVVTCSGCTAVTGISAFPADSFPLWNWSSTSGTWDVSGSTDQRTIVQKGADPLAAYLIASADTQLKNAINLGALTTGYLKATISAGVATISSVATTFNCQPGLGDGLNAMPAGTYLQSECFNTLGATYTITGIRCFTDNAGTSTLNVTNGAGTALLTGAVTCNATFPGAAGTQSGTVTIANNDGVKFTFVADGTSKQTTWIVTGTR